MANMDMIMTVTAAPAIKPIMSPAIMTYSSPTAPGYTASRLLSIDTMSEIMRIDAVPIIICAVGGHLFYIKVAFCAFRTIA